jgi:hypothetical protein
MSRTRQGTPISVKRLLPGDEFLRGGSEQVYRVFGRFIDHTINMRVESHPRPHDTMHPPVRSSEGARREFLEITTTPERVLTGLIFVDMNTGLGYTDMSDPLPIPGFKLDDTVIIISPIC